MDPVKRWYDVDPRISEAIKAWETFPYALQVILATYINQHIQEQKTALLESEEPGNLPELTPRQLLGIYMAAQKRRWHDEDPVIRSAMNSLSLAERADQLAICKRITKVKAFLEGQHSIEDNLPEEVVVAMLSEVLDKILNAPL